MLFLLPLMLAWNSGACSERVNQREKRLEQRFLSEYPSHAQKLRQFYSALRITATRTAEFSSGEVLSHEEYAANDRLYRRIVDRQRGEGAGGRGVAVANPDLSFMLSRRDGAAPFAITDIDDYNGALLGLRLSSKAIFAPYCFYELTIVDFMREPEFRVTKVTEVARDGASLVKVAWADPIGDIHRLGWFLFSPADCWALREYELSSQGPGSERPSLLRGVIEYSGHADTVPLVSKLEYWTELPKGAAKTNREVIDVVSIVPGHVPGDEFTMESFGVTWPGVGVGNRRVLMLAAITAGFLALAATLAWLRKRASWKIWGEDRRQC